MSEIAKCPLCGKNPDVYHAMTSPGQRLLVKIECCDHAVASPLSLIEKWNQYAAAMELARATRLLEDAMEPLNSGKLKMGEALPRIKLAMEHEKGCEKRVLEVFGGE